LEKLPWRQESTLEGEHGIGRPHRRLLGQSSGIPLPARDAARRSFSKPFGIDDGLGELLGRFLRRVVADAALEKPVLVLAGEAIGVGSRIRMWSAVRIPSIVIVGTLMLGKAASLFSSASNCASPCSRPSRQR